MIRISVGSGRLIDDEGQGLQIAFSALASASPPAPPGSPTRRSVGALPGPAGLDGRRQAREQPQRVAVQHPLGPALGGLCFDLTGFA
ncbi:hypothetical protein OH809_04830 [Streptomyces sp. NBC_00873]|uniref:hypothetical protein n=1 Tax=unclassified Streptomyces TaxID=2593676 RepID=UPI003868F4D9|nr:hypothetical protein OH809_04830 [Streptomyces sp. NBC_00873]WTA47831.1 hypothetical protein OH821_38960 [Streptomyces sp. NBC_00842]